MLPCGSHVSFDLLPFPFTRKSSLSELLRRQCLGLYILGGGKLLVVTGVTVLGKAIRH